MRLEIAQLDRRYEALRICDRARHRRLVSSLLESGQRTPVVVTGDGQPGRYVLIDGYARVRALVELSRDEVEAVALAMSELEALLFLRHLQTGQPRSALEEGWWVVELLERYGKSQREVSQLLERTVSWVSRRVALVRVLPESVQAAVRSGEITPQGAMHYLVPLARANAEACTRLVSGLCGERVSVRELGVLYAGWKEGDAEAREALVSHPRLYLQASSARAERAKELGAIEVPVARELEVVAGLCRKIRRRVRAGALECLRWPARRAVLRAWQELELLIVSLRALIEESVDAGPGHADGDLALAPGGPRAASDRPLGGDLQERRAPGGA
jgi:ParB/RepB/Spo0J family partition protein